MSWDMFDDSDRITEYLKHKNKRSVRGERTRHNDAAMVRAVGAKRDLSSLSRRLSVCREMLAAFGEESGARVDGRIQAAYTMNRSMRRQRQYLDSLLAALNEWSVADGALAGAISRSLGQIEDRVDRIEATFLPEYFELCGLDGYAGWLAENGSSIRRDIDGWFKREAGEAPGVSADRKERVAWWREKSLAYYGYAKEEARRNGIPLGDPRGRIAGEEALGAARAEKIREEKRQESLAAWSALAKEALDMAEGAVQDALRRGVPKKGRPSVPLRAIDRIRRDAGEAGAMTACVAAVASLRSNPSVRFVRRSKEGGAWEGGAPWMFGPSEAFYGDSAAEAAEAAAREAAGGRESVLCRVMTFDLSC